MDLKTIFEAKKQAKEHAEWIGEYTKYIYKHAHYHGFKHGYEYVKPQKKDYTQPPDTPYMKACKILAKSLVEEEQK